MISGSFAKLTTVTASTQRQGAVASGLSGDLAENLASLKCLPLDPLSPEVAATIGIEAFAETLMTMCQDGLDVLEGDVLVINSDTYKIRAVGQWTWRPTATATLMLILEEIK